MYEVDESYLRAFEAFDKSTAGAPIYTSDFGVLTGDDITSMKRELVDDYISTHDPTNPQHSIDFYRLLNDLNLKGTTIDKYMEVWNNQANISNELKYSDPQFAANRMRSAGMNPDLQGVESGKADSPQSVSSPLASQQDVIDMQKRQAAFQNAAAGASAVASAFGGLGSLIQGGVSLFNLAMGIKSFKTDQSIKGMQLYGMFEDFALGYYGDNLGQLSDFIKKDDKGVYGFDFESYSKSDKKLNVSADEILSQVPYLDEGTAGKLATYVNGYLDTVQGQRKFLESAGDLSKLKQSITESVNMPTYSTEIGSANHYLKYLLKLNYRSYVALTEDNISKAEFDKLFWDNSDPYLAAKAKNQRSRKEFAEDKYYESYYNALDPEMQAEADSLYVDYMVEDTKKRIAGLSSMDYGAMNAASVAESKYKTVQFGLEEVVATMKKTSFFDMIDPNNSYWERQEAQATYSALNGNTPADQGIIKILSDTWQNILNFRRGKIIGRHLGIRGGEVLSGPGSIADWSLMK